MVTIDDIDIFIATHNRADYLKESIQSLLNQTLNVKEIIILDNESIDDTENIVKSFSNNGVRYVKTYGFLGNFKKCQSIAAKKYCMLFHDDDIVHPRYLEFVVKLLNKYDDLSIVTTRYTEFFDDKVPNFLEEISDEAYIFKKQCEFAKFLYYKEIVAYATAIYKTEYFKQCPLEYEKFNKFNDWPFMVKMAGYGKSAIFKDYNLFYIRRHSGQDTWTSTNTPTVEQIVNWDLFFKNILCAKNDYNAFCNFVERYKHFLLGKYRAFLSPDDKSKYSETDIINIAKKMGIEEFNSWYKIIYFIKKMLAEILSIRNSNEQKHKIITIFGMKLKIKRS